ncbi:MAG: hypothetical protein ACI9O4_001942 [Chitinophagales bacterium]|jgi:hypothetical protein
MVANLIYAYKNNSFAIRYMPIANTNHPKAGFSFLPGI